MNEATAILITQLLRGAFTLIYGLRQFIGSNDEIKARFDRIDAGGEPITPDEVRAKGNEWQAAIDEGREIG